MGEYTGTVPTFLAGEWVDASKLLEVTNALTALTAAWTSYTPTWTAFSVNPSLGNGVLAAAYRRLGKTVDFRISLRIGSTTTTGTGQWALSLPSTPIAEFACPFFAYDDSAALRYRGLGRIVTSGKVELHSADGASANTQSNQPFTWANNDFISLSGSYEVA